MPHFLWILLIPQDHLLKQTSDTPSIVHLHFTIIAAASFTFSGISTYFSLQLERP